ncbi:tyrosinase family oxidase copper chaperone [Streptomyces sp. NPDC032472]|uniref:apotyrosinase chaperone MelC1 n=1 Tax=Streptomyces sp. NPDC032472 TaxID=3155018 RepID=UPI0033EA03C7
MKKITRRQALGFAIGAAAVVGLSACSSSKAPATAAIGAEASGSPSVPPFSLPSGGIDEVYEGHRIQITLGEGGQHGGHHLPAMPVVKIDGNELHIMRNADGSWVSVVNHYETFPDPIAAAKAAIRDLQGTQLAPFGPHEGGSTS